MSLHNETEIYSMGENKIFKITFYLSPDFKRYQNMKIQVIYFSRKEITGQINMCMWTLILVGFKDIENSLPTLFLFKGDINGHL